MSRRIDGLLDAKRLDARPGCIPVGRPRGVKRLGITYEIALAGALPGASKGTWWAFRDNNGPGYCQTDFVLLGQTHLLVLEAKHTFTCDAWGQLEDLYLPVVALATGRSVIGVQVCKNLGGYSGPVATGLREAAQRALAGQRTVLHWSGFTSLVPDHNGAKPSRAKELA